MKVYHLNCGTMCPFGRRWLTGEGGVFERARLVCHCLLIETNAGLVLIETGVGQHDIDKPGRLGVLSNFFLQPAYRYEETAIAQVRALGFAPEDVRHIVVTHLDLDHAGGLPDFPFARVHVYKDEYKAAKRRATLADRGRYLPHQWSHDVQWELYETQGERWFDLEAVRALRGLFDDILLIPLIGHTRGHCAVALRHEGQWLMHCGDAYFSKQQITSPNADCPPFLTLFQNLAQWNKRLRLQNLERLRDLARDHHDEIHLFSAHAAAEYDAFCKTNPREVV